jgi:hypothetical protein
MNWRPRRQWRRTPYYKVQVWDAIGLTWMDEKPAFDSVQEARLYIVEKLDPNARIRLMLVTNEGRSPLPEEGRTEWPES